jgi:hypothetical protein
MVRNVIGPEEGTELKRLYEEYVAAINQRRGHIAD